MEAACTRELSRSSSERPRPHPATATTTAGRRQKRPAVRHRSAARAIGNGWLDIVDPRRVAGSAQSGCAGNLRRSRQNGRPPWQCAPVHGTAAGWSATWDASLLPADQVVEPGLRLLANSHLLLDLVERTVE